MIPFYISLHGSSLSLSSDITIISTLSGRILYNYRRHWNWISCNWAVGVGHNLDETNRWLTCRCAIVVDRPNFTRSKNSCHWSVPSWYGRPCAIFVYFVTDIRLWNDELVLMHTENACSRSGCGNGQAGSQSQRNTVRCCHSTGKIRQCATHLLSRIHHNGCGLLTYSFNQRKIQAANLKQCRGPTVRE